MYWLLLIILLCLIVFIVWENITVVKTYYKIRIPKMNRKLKGTKIIHLSDLHFPNERLDLKKLVQNIKDEEPDIIVITGDIIEGELEHNAFNQLRYLGNSLKMTAPIYAVAGNNDLDYLDGDKWRATLENNNIHVLLDESIWVPLKGYGIVLMGLKETHEMNDPGVVPDNQYFMNNIHLKEGMYDQTTILLAHHPEYFERYLKRHDLEIDLVLSGHTHGGQIYMPYIGGVYAPGQGFNPHYDYGYFASEKEPDKRLIINGGLSTSNKTIRLFNKMEIGIIELQ